MPLDRMRSLELHRKARGKIKIYPTVNIHSEEDLALAYVPGSVAPALAIQENVEKSFEYTGKGNRVAVISDGTAILGLGDVGPEAGMPVIEGKCLLFKLFGDVNAIPLCVNSPRNAEDIIHLAMMLAPNFGGINIEDISSPNTFTVVRELQNRLDIPVFCDDQQGTAVVVLAGLWNALEIVAKRLSEISIVICGAGAAGIATAELLFTAGAKNVTVLNSTGILGPENPNMNHVQEELSKKTNPEGRKGGIDAALRGADVLIGVSRGGVISQEAVASMNDRSIVFALALPEPEIDVEAARAAGAAVVATGLLRENANPMLNLHAFPGIMRGALDVRATTFTPGMFLAAAETLATAVDRRRLTPQHILPSVFSDEVAPRIAEAVAQTAVREGVAANPLPAGTVYNETWQRLFAHVMGAI